jgi:ATP synthase protein I
MSANMLKNKVQREAYLLVGYQLLAVSLLAIGSAILFGKKLGLGFFLGGMAYGLPTLLFVFIVFRFTGARQMNFFVLAFFLGEMMKLFISGILFLVIVKYLAFSLLSLLVGFAAAIVSFWVVCLVYFSRPVKIQQDISS